MRPSLKPAPVRAGSAVGQAGPIRPDKLNPCCVDALAGNGRGQEGAQVGCTECGAVLGFRAGAWEWVGRTRVRCTP